MITQRQKECLELIAKAEICPSYDELIFAMGLKSKSGVNRLLNGLEERGMINRIPDRARAIELTAWGHACLYGGETILKRDVDFLINRIHSDLFFLKSAIGHGDTKEELISHIEGMQKLIKEKWSEK